MSGNLALKDNYTNFDLMSAIGTSELASGFDLKTTTFAVLFNLCNCYNYKSGVVFPSIETLARRTNASEKTVSSAIKELVEKRLIIKTKKGKHNVYCFTNVFWEFIKIQADKTNKITRPKNQKNTSKSFHHTGKNYNSIPVNFTGKQNNINKINNNYYLRQNFSNDKNQPEGQNYKSIEKTQAEQAEIKNIKLGSPLDLSKEEALNYLTGLIPELKKSYFAKELRKKWNFSAEELNQTVENFQPKTKSHILGDNLTAEVDKECLAGKSSLLNTGKILRMMDFKTFTEN